MSVRTYSYVVYVRYRSIIYLLKYHLSFQYAQTSVVQERHPHDMRYVRTYVYVRAYRGWKISTVCSLQEETELIEWVRPRPGNKYLCCSTQFEALLLAPIEAPSNIS